MSANGWRSGNDPTVRALRTLMAVVLIASIPLMLILDRADPAVASAIIIGLLVLLGVVEGVVRLPDWLRQSQVGTPPPPPLKEEDDA